MKRLFKEIIITSSAGTITLNATDFTNEYCIIGSDVTINTGLNITMTGMSKGHAVKIYWSQKVTRGVNTVTVLGKVLTHSIVNDIVIFAMYNGSSWDVWELPAELEKLIIKDHDGNVTWGEGSTATGTTATAWGRDTMSTADDATAFGNGSTASGAKSTAFGDTSEASGDNATSFGKSSEASGESATAFGEGCVASGDYATAFGEGCVASGDYATAFGAGCDATGIYSTAFGYNTTASGSASTSFGDSTTASAQYSTAFGDGNTASGISSIAMGSNNTASGQRAVVWGDSNVASGDFSTAWGGADCLAVGDYTTSFGYGNEANDYLETTFGRFATISTGSTESWVDTDVLWKIGNGSSVSERGDALTMLKNGDTTVSGIWTFVGGISYTNPSLSATTVEEALDEIVELILGS